MSCLQGLLGKQLIRLAFSLASWSDCGGDDEMSPQQAIDEGHAMIEQAIKIFEEVCMIILKPYYFIHCINSSMSFQF